MRHGSPSWSLWWLSCCSAVRSLRLPPPSSRCWACWWCRGWSQWPRRSRDTRTRSCWQSPSCLSWLKCGCWRLHSLFLLVIFFWCELTLRWYSGRWGVHRPAVPRQVCAGETAEPACGAGALADPGGRSVGIYEQHRPSGHNDPRGPELVSQHRSSAIAAVDASQLWYHLGR